MLDLFRKNRPTILLFFLCFMGGLFFSGTLSAENPHEGLLGQSLTSGEIVHVPPKKKEDKQNKKGSSRPTKMNSPRGQSETASVQANQISIDSHNIVTGSVDAGHGADLTIGATDMSNAQLDTAEITTENTVYGRVKGRGDETRYRMGTVDVEGIRGGDLGISTLNTVQGDVSVKKGQDVSIGVVEMGKPRKSKKDNLEKDTPRGMEGTENDVIEFIEIDPHGKAITMPQTPVNSTEAEEAQNGICSGKPICTEPNTCCAGIINETCHDINGCSSVADTLGSYTFGIPDGPVKQDNIYIPCNSHDQCYQTCGTDKKSCDIQLYYDMIEECRFYDPNFNDEKILLPDQIENKLDAGLAALGDITKNAGVRVVVVSGAGIIASGGTGTPAAIAAGVEEGAKKFAKDLVLATLTDGNVRKTEKNLILAIPSFLCISDSISNATDYLSDFNEDNKKDEKINAWKKKQDRNLTGGKKVVNTMADNVQTMMHDAAASIETGAVGLHAFLEQKAYTVNPKKSFVASVLEKPARSCGVAKNIMEFMNYMGCELVHIPSDTIKKTKQLATAGAWATQKANSYFLEGAGEVVDYIGNNFAKDLRFVGSQGVPALRYAGNKSLELSNTLTKLMVDGIDLAGEFALDELIYTIDSLGDSIRKYEDLLLDCLSIAENYYFGVLNFASFSFRGDEEYCLDNKVDGEERCCVVNLTYQYHRSNNIQDTMGNILTPFENLCEEKTGN